MHCFQTNIIYSFRRLSDLLYFPWNDSISMFPVVLLWNMRNISTLLCPPRCRIALLPQPSHENRDVKGAKVKRGFRPSSSSLGGWQNNLELWFSSLSVIGLESSCHWEWTRERGTFIFLDSFYRYRAYTLAKKLLGLSSWPSKCHHLFIWWKCVVYFFEKYANLVQEKTE